MADAAASEAAALTAWRFKSSRVHHILFTRGHAGGAHSARHANPTRGLASPSGQGIGPTQTFPRFESWSEHHYFSRSSKAERPADNRKTAVRYRAGEPRASIKLENTMTTLIKPGRSPPHLRSDGPGAFKPETVGQRAFNPCARGSTPPGSSSHSSHTTSSSG
jgi:hypothetical protein